MTNTFMHFFYFFLLNPTFSHIDFVAYLIYNVGVCKLRGFEFSFFSESTRFAIIF